MVDKKEEHELGVEDTENRTSKKAKLETGNEPGEDEDSERIVKQLEYYFSDVNIVKDKFLLGETKKNDGWVKLPTLLTFVRLKALTQEESKIVQAIKKHPSDIIELDEGEKRIRRKNPVPDADEFQKQLEQRFVHLSGFPSDYTFEMLRKFCGQFGELDSVSMRNHYKTRQFKGCVHVVYKSVADAKNLIDKEVVKCKDREIRKESMESYQKRKAEIAEKRKENRKSKKTNRASVKQS